MEGKILPFTSNILRKKRRPTGRQQRVKTQNGSNKGCAHTFCSNWLALHKDVNELVLQSGHDSVDTMWRNYHQGVTEKEGKKFWAIQPAKGPKTSYRSQCRLPEGLG
jgi:integrase